nr:TRAP transporter large permease subunit [Synergistaceae bacterium]
LGLSIANAIVKIAGGLMLPTLLLTMVACILLGAGLPTTANFIVTSTMAAPALFKLGVPPMAAYMFVLYFGIAADLSPPVALAAYAGAGIAGDDPMKTGMTAVKLALAGFLVPYIYVFNPMLVLVGVSLKGAFFTILAVILFGLSALTAINKEKSSRARTIGAVLAGVGILCVAGLVLAKMVPFRYAMALMTALMGVFLLGMSTVGFYKVSMPLWLRLVAMAGALGLLVPGLVTDATGLGVLIFLHLIQTMREKKSLTPRAS